MRLTNLQFIIVPATALLEQAGPRMPWSINARLLVLETFDFERLTSQISEFKDQIN
jgi:hypothetical protein|tara:strand:- start:4411 stop:4578 length:168 start_codon:yes stop_codon:yes gene_type:complete